MKRGILILLVCLGVAGTGARAGETWTVCADGCDFAQIQHAVDLAEDGDTVRVLDAVHTEARILIDKVVTVEGLGKHATVIQGAEAPPGPFVVFSIGVNGAMLRDMTIRNGMVGVSLGGFGRLHFVLERLRLVDLDTGIRVDSFSPQVWNVEVWDSEFRDLGTAASAPSGKSSPGVLTFVRSELTGSGFEGPQRTNLVESTFQGSTRGISTVTLFLVNSTVSGNRVAGPLLRGVVIQAIHSTIVDNLAESAFNARALLMDHSILAGNRVRRDGCEDESCEEALDCPLTSAFELFSRGHNLFGSDGACFSDDPDDAYVDSETVFTATLGRLQNNGGPTPTHTPLADGPAIDSGAVDCADADQRGLPRPIDGDGDGEARCDTGAVEALPANVRPHPGGIPDDVSIGGPEED